MRLGCGVDTDSIDAKSTFLTGTKEGEAVLFGRPWGGRVARMTGIHEARSRSGRTDCVATY